MKNLAPLLVGTSLFMALTLTACDGGGGTVTALVAGTGGTIEPANREVAKGKTGDFTIIPDSGHGIADVSGCGGTLKGNTYTTGEIKSDCTVTASFAPVYTVITQTEEGAQITPAQQEVVRGQSAVFSVVVKSGFNAPEVSGCQGRLEGNVYTTGKIKSDCTVTASFAPVYTISTQMEEGAQITPALQEVVRGQSAVFSVVVKSGYNAPEVSGCKGRLDGNVYTTGEITNDCTVSATTSPARYHVMTAVGPGGSIEPIEQTVGYGFNATVTVAPEKYYSIGKVSGCRGNLDGNTYTTGEIGSDCVITAVFSPDQHRITARAGAGGIITPEDRLVDHGTRTSVTVSPNEGYTIIGVSGCEGTLAGNTYTTEAITADCEVSADFASIHTVGGTMSGLDEGRSLVLQNNGKDDLIVSSDGEFAFAVPVLDGASYAVTIAEQPVGQKCSISDGRGTVNGARVTNVFVGDCTAAPPPAPKVKLDYGIKELRFSWQPVEVATHYKLSEDTDGQSGFTQVGGDLTTTEVTQKIALHRRINARYRIEACNSVGCSGTKDIVPVEHLVGAVGHIKAPDITSSGIPDVFGHSVAVSADGNMLAVGAPHEDGAGNGVNGDDTDNSVTSSGAVYVFTLSDTGWLQQAYIKASNTGKEDRFGVAVALSADGNTLAVGAPFEDSNATGINGDESNNSAAESGAVYVFTRSGTDWSQQAYIKASNVGEMDYFGQSIALSGDGGTIAVGAFREDSNATGINSDQSDNSAKDSGAVYVFKRSDTGWSQQAYVKATNMQAFVEFGYSVALSTDGNTLAVGAMQEDNGATGINSGKSDSPANDSGAVYIFTRSNTSWSQQAYVKASNTGMGDSFGYSVALSGNGNTLAVGAPNEDGSVGLYGNDYDNPVRDCGAVYVFTRTGEEWSQQGYINAVSAGTSDGFGTSVSLSTDGNTLAVGAPEEDSAAYGVNGESKKSANRSGAAYLFAHADGGWSQFAYLKASNTHTGNLFGTSLDLSGDGDTVAVGATQEQSAATGINGEGADVAASQSGAVYLY